MEQVRIGADVVTAAGPAETPLAAYRRHPLVRYAVPDRLVELSFTPDDPHYGVQWHIDLSGAWDATTEPPACTLPSATPVWTAITRTWRPICG